MKYDFEIDYYSRGRSFARMIAMIGIPAGIDQRIFRLVDIEHVSLGSFSSWSGVHEIRVASLDYTTIRNLSLAAFSTAH